MNIFIRKSDNHTRPSSARPKINCVIRIRYNEILSFCKDLAKHSLDSEKFTIEAINQLKTIEITNYTRLSLQTPNENEVY